MCSKLLSLSKPKKKKKKKQAKERSTDRKRKLDFREFKENTMDPAYKTKYLKIRKFKTIKCDDDKAQREREDKCVIYETR